jgi:transcriptional regulator with XRE-family HTH domain
MQSVLSATQAKDARAALALSQGKVASDLKINRAYLSLFESGRYVLPDSVLTALREYYEQHGHTFEKAPKGKTTGNKPAVEPDAQEGARLMDGFLVPAALDQEAAEALLAEYSENRAKLDALCEQAPRDSIFFGPDESDMRKRQREVLMLMARNYVLVEQLHGHATVHDCIGDGKQKTIGVHVREAIEQVFPPAEQPAAA